MWFKCLHSIKEVPYGLFTLHVQLDFTIGSVKRKVKTARRTAKKIYRKAKRRAKKARAGTKMQRIFTYHAYYQSGTKLKNGKASSYKEMTKNMQKDPNAFESAIYTLPMDVVLMVTTGGSFGAAKHGKTGVKTVNSVKKILHFSKRRGLLQYKKLTLRT